MKIKAKDFVPNKKDIKNAIPEATGAVFLYLPVNVSLETVVAGMSDEVSLKTRGIATVLTYLTMPLIMKTRRITQQLTNTTPESSEGKKWLVDTLYGAAFGFATRAGMYYLGGEPELDKIMIAAGSGAGVGALTGGLSLYFIDVFRDLMGFQKSVRTPSFLKQKTKNFKQRVAYTFIAASIATAASIYALTPNSKQPHDNKVQIAEQYNGQKTTNDYLMKD